MYYSRLTNKQRSDSDPGFKIEIKGMSRARWSLVLDQLQELREQNKIADKETNSAFETVVNALKSHLLEHADGYTLAINDEPAVSDIEMKALLACRARHKEELAQREKLAKEVEWNLKEKQRKGEKLSADQKTFLESCL